MSDLNRIELGSSELPEVIRTLAGVLHQFEGADLESQLQTYDIFLETLSPSVRPEVANLIQQAAARAASPEARARIEAAAASVASGGRAAEIPSHEKTMAAYQKSFHESFPNAPAPTTPADPRDEANAKPGEKRSHPDILAQCELIEAELKRIGRWSSDTAAYKAAIDRGEVKSFLDAPTFEMWLQVVLLPHARQWALDDCLPDTSQTGEMGRRQYDYMSIDHDAFPLMALLRHFDELVVSSHQGRA
jgi:uncharacterized protein YqcC (DUF446 family)